MVKSGARVSDELLASLDVGEESGCLPERLSTFASWHDPEIAAFLARAVGRPPETTRFAAALAKLLIDHRLTLRLVRDAGSLVASDRSAFSKAIREVVSDMKEGATFVEALHRHPKSFDAFFCTLLRETNERGKLRSVLAMLGNSGHG